jgi:hypothetical protein
MDELDREKCALHVGNFHLQRMALFEESMRREIDWPGYFSGEMYSQNQTTGFDSILLPLNFRRSQATRE